MMDPGKRDGYLYSAALVLPRLAGFLLLPGFAAALSLQDMGRLTTCWIFIDLIQTLAGLGMRQALGRFFPLAEDAASRRRVLTAALAGGVLGSLLTAVLAWAVFAYPRLRGGWNFLNGIDGRLYFFLVAAAALGNLVSTLIIYFRAERRAGTFLAAALAGALLELGLSGTLLVSHRVSVSRLLAVEGLKQAVMLLYIMWQCRRDLFPPSFSKETAVALAAFGVWLVPVGLCDWLMASSDRFWLGQLADMSEVGVYGFFAKFAVPLGILFTGWVMEMHSRIYRQRDEAGLELARQGLDGFLTRGGWLALGLAAAFPAAFRVAAALRPIFPAAYLHGLHVFPLLVGVAYTFYWGRYYGTALEYRFRTRAILFSLGASALGGVVFPPLLILGFSRAGWDRLTAAALAAFLAALVSVATMGALARLGGGLRQSLKAAAVLSGCALCAWLTGRLP